MSNLARKHQQHYNEPVKQTEVQVKTIRRHSKITPGEKFIGMLLIAFVAVMAIQIISAQAAIYEVNKDIEDVKTAIQEQQKVNGDLEIQVSDLSRYERVWNKAKELGLNLDENNVRVVEKK
ncbi:cell division protein FtsL [Lederbergia citrea]|uniref:Cell division protein FtsL n=1 Tax=Lederbergia citrea TaxID=2833581 RepID=A0A942Z3N0_9BACI|nr:cell division protein FtsL [Lederbergia citrea]MBS4177217.1 cell division protein FtsL [Lederbergia citrea]MBS4203880.1 cell division protein FtsL [Lederbergia citrea]MBS4221535.1 cell division protein FtsL [Lederbergia citrea]